MEKLFGWTDRERGGFLAVERTQAHEVGAAFFELDIAAHHLDHVNAGEKFLDEGLGDGHVKKG